MENIYIVYEKHLWSYIQGADFTLGNSLFDATKLTKLTKIKLINILISDMVLYLGTRKFFAI